MGSRTLWLWMFVGSLGVTALLGMMALLMPSVPYEIELLATSGLLSAYSLLGLVASLAIAKGRARALAWASVAALGLSLAVWLALVWIDTRHWQVEEFASKVGGTLTIVGLLALHSVLLQFPRLERSAGRAARVGTIGAAISAGCLAMLLLWEIDLFHETTVGRLMGALLIPAALGTIAVPVLARIEHVGRREGEERTLDRHVRVWLRCPRCGREGEQPANRRSLCTGCGLESTVSLSEPRCVCGYLLHGLPDPVCPECGRAVEPEHWWRDAARPAGPAPAP